MEAPPSPPFIVSKTEFLLEVLVVALDALAQLGQVDQGALADGLGQGREPVF